MTITIGIIRVKSVVSQIAIALSTTTNFRLLFKHQPTIYLFLMGGNGKEKHEMGVFVFVLSSRLFLLFVAHP